MITDRFEAREDVIPWNRKAYELGRRAEKRGKGMSDNAYAVSSWHLHKSWDAGWVEANAERLAVRP